MKKSDAILLQDLRGLVAREREVLIDLLRHLREVERRELYLARGYSSLFAFCEGELGYSNAEAQYRISAMRLMRDLPEVEESLADGGLSLTVAAAVQSKFRGKKIAPERKMEILGEVTGISSRAAERILAEIFPEDAKPERARAVAGGKTRIEFTASESLMEKLNRLKEILAHKNYDGRFDLLFEELADRVLKELEPEAIEPEAIGLVDRPASGAGESLAIGAVDRTAIEAVGGPAPLASRKPNSLGAPKVKRSRYVPAAVRRGPNHGCEYIDPETGRRCGTRHGLQFDHIMPFAEGGTNAPENFQRLCGPHNRYRWRKRK